MIWLKLRIDDNCLLTFTWWHNYLLMYNGGISNIRDLDQQMVNCPNKELVQKGAVADSKQ